MNPVTTFLFEHRAKIAAGLAVLALCGLSYGLGKSQAEERVEIQEKIVEKEVIQARLVYRDREESKIDEKKDTKKDVRRVVTEVTKPDGTVEKKTEEHAVDETHEARVEEKIVEKVVKEQVFVDRVVEVEKKVEVEKSMPDWRFGLTVGAAPLTMFDAGELKLEDVIVGAQLQRRIVGPVSANLFAQTNGVVGVGLSLEF